MSHFALNAEVLRRYPPTETLINAAKVYNVSVEVLIQSLLYKPMELPVACSDGLYRNAVWLPFTVLGTDTYGPSPQYKIMAIAKSPGREEVALLKNMVGASGQLFTDSIQELGIDAKSIYFGNVVRFMHPDNSDRLSKEAINSCNVLLAQDLAICQPEYVFLLGADAVKVVCGSTFTLSKLRSEVFLVDLLDLPGKVKTLIPYQVTDKANDRGKVKLFTTIHPAAVVREQGLKYGFVADLKLFHKLLYGSFKSKAPTEQGDYYLVRSPTEAKVIVDYILDNYDGYLAVDCEWGMGDFINGTLRTVQVSWCKGCAAVFVLCGSGGREIYTPQDKYAVVEHIRRLFNGKDGKPPKLIGHNFREDAKWLETIGLSVMDKFYADTMLMDHCLVHENTGHGLDDLALRYTDMSRYSLPLTNWLNNNGYSSKRLEKHGFINVPDELLLPYAACDADATYRCYIQLMRIADREENKELKRLFFDVIMPCNYAIYEMETTGLPIDVKALAHMGRVYKSRKAELQEELRLLSGKPEFNPSSYKQVSSFLFGLPSEGGLGLTPYKTTGKPAKMWNTLSQEELKRCSPSTDSESLEAIANKHPFVAKMTEYRLVEQMCKTFVADETTDEDTGEATYEKGLMHYVSPDGRIHTSISQMTVTGRHTSSRPNCHNWPKKQEAALERIMQGHGVDKLRTVLVASPGKVLVEADFESAELVVLGYLSNDEVLLASLKGDLHARGAVFSLGAPKWDGFDEHKKPPKSWREQYDSLRIAAKTINFGIPYGRGADALAREIESETKGLVRCDRKKAQSLIDDFMSQYKHVAEYIKLCSSLAETQGWISNPFGRRRRIQPSKEHEELATQKREFVNFPIQSSVADDMNISLYKIWNWRRLNPGRCNYKILLSIHDAVILEVDATTLDVVYDEVLVECMAKTEIPSWQPVPWWPKSKPFSLNIDRSVMVRWGKSATVSELIERGVPESSAHKYAKG